MHFPLILNRSTWTLSISTCKFWTFMYIIDFYDDMYLMLIGINENILAEHDINNPIIWYVWNLIFGFELRVLVDIKIFFVDVYNSHIKVTFAYFCLLHKKYNDINCGNYFDNFKVARNSWYEEYFVKHSCLTFFKANWKLFRRST